MLFTELDVVEKHAEAATWETVAVKGKEEDADVEEESEEVIANQ
jgi:hypothetical protein